MAKPKRGGKREGLSKALRAAVGRPTGGGKDYMVTAVKNTNPNNYRMNCQRCVCAYELQRRGYDVEALPWQGGNSDVMFENGRWMKMFDGQTWDYRLGTRNTQVKRNIEEKMANWGEGARAIVYVAWKTGKAHVFNVEQRDGKLVAVDAQTGRHSFPIESYLDNAKPSKTMISRVDNLKPNDNFLYAVKKRGK